MAPGEHAVWGKHTLFSESLRSPLIITPPKLAQPGPFSEAVVSTIDIFPTLCDLALLPTPPKGHGKSLVPQLVNPQVPSRRHAVAYHGSKKPRRSATHRLILHPKGAVELYDLRTPAAETKNVAADNPKIVSELKTALNQALSSPR